MNETSIRGVGVYATSVCSKWTDENVLLNLDEPAAR
jgi:hypothetical protein